MDSTQERWPGAPSAPQHPSTSDWHEWEHEDLYFPPPSPVTRDAIAEYFGDLDGESQSEVDHQDREKQEKTEEAPENGASDSVPLPLSGCKRTPNTVSSKTNFHDKSVEEQLIWQLTHDYLNRIGEVCAESSPSSLKELSAKLKTRSLGSGPLAPRCSSFAVKALEIVAKCIPRKRQRSSHAHEEGEDAGCAYGDQKFPRKTGRKPEHYCCSLCESEFPYKRTLIRHMQQDHAVQRCQSVLYKRLKQGGNYFDRFRSSNSE